MAKRLPLLLLTGVLALAACRPDAEPAGHIEEPLAVILAGGTVHAGDGDPPFTADVGISGDRIAAIGNLSDRTAPLRLDVSGLAVTPGFIDIHNHAIRENPERSGIFRWPDAENLIRQGVTTAIGGPDGGSPLPIADSLAALEQSPAAVNFGTFVGHGSVRKLIVGEEDRPASADEMARMRAEVATAMEAGAFGLSSGLVYAPGSFAPTDEVVALAAEAGRYGGIYITHMRQEGLDILKSVAETIAIGEQAGVPAQITHHKIIGASMWGQSVETLALVDAARARGLDVSIDQYPYTASSTRLTVLFPRWALDGDAAARASRRADPEQRERLRKAIVFSMVEDRGGNDPAKVALADCSWDPSLNGLNLSQVLQRQSRPVTIDEAAELVIELQAAGGCSAVYHAIAEDDVVRIMRHPQTMIASDGGIEAPGNGVPHPRNYGAFARVLGHYVRERGVLSFESAIHKMSRMPAERIGLDDRGRLEPGAIADIAVVDPRRVIDRATFADPHQYAEGVRHVFVAGQAVLLNAQMTGARPGRVLRSSR